MRDFYQRGPLVTLLRLVPKDLARHQKELANSFAVAVFNGPYFDRHGEEEAAETFSRAVAEGCAAFARDPLGIPPLPNWERGLAALPDAGSRLLGAVGALGGVVRA
ncbi:MAG: hypothetical protein ACP5NF_02940 [Thermoanaerobaculum sp.]